MKNMKNMKRTLLFSLIFGLLLVCTAFAAEERVIVKENGKFVGKIIENSVQSMSKANTQNVYPDNKLSLLEVKEQFYQKVVDGTVTQMKVASSTYNPLDMISGGRYKMDVSMAFHQMTPKKSEMGKDVKVCILDTGIYEEHSYFVNNEIITADFTTDDEPVYGAAKDTVGHGTHVAGIVSKAVPYATIFMGKVCSNEYCWESDIIEGMYWCEEQGADIISLSLGMNYYNKPCDTYPISQVVNELSDNGILTVAAGGNQQHSYDNQIKVAVPACAEKGIAVSAVELMWYDSYAGNHVVFNPANYDITNTFTTCYIPTGQCVVYDPGFNLIDITANGDVTSAWIDGTEKPLMGTSMATPHVSGAVAQLCSIRPDADSETVRQALYDGATAGYAGKGLLNNGGSCEMLIGDEQRVCEGYKISDYDSKATPKDWIQFKVDDKETLFRRYAVTSKNKKSFDLTNYLKYNYKGWTLNEIDNLYVLTRTTNIRKQTTVQMEVWDIRTTDRGVYINKFRENPRSRIRLKPNFKYVALNCTGNPTNECKQYIKEAGKEHNNLINIHLA